MFLFSRQSILVLPCWAKYHVPGFLLNAINFRELERGMSFHCAHNCVFHSWKKYLLIQILGDYTLNFHDVAVQLAFLILRSENKVFLQFSIIFMKKSFLKQIHGYLRCLLMLLQYSWHFSNRVLKTSYFYTFSIIFYLISDLMFINTLTFDLPVHHHCPY